MNNFIPFTVAFDDDFINREPEIKRILTGIGKDTNLAVVGNPHIGKTSLLSKLVDTFFSSSTETDKSHYALVKIEFPTFSEQETAHDFWETLVMEAVDSNPDVSHPLKLLLKNNKLDPHDLSKAFRQIGRTKDRVVVFIDEFDYLFNLENFRTLDFLGPLKSISMNSKGLKVVTTSHLSVYEMNALAEEHGIAKDTDFFSYLKEIELGVFSDAIIDEWFTSQNIDKKYTHEIKKIAGHHPLLLQIGGEIFYEICEEEQNEEDILSRLNNEFIQRVQSHFHNIWRYLSDKAQIALVIFALKKSSGNLDDETKFSLKEAEKVLTWYSSEIEKMVRHGTLEIDKEGKYVFGSEAFCNWVIKEKILGTRGGEPQKAFEKWLHNKEYKLGELITNEQIAFLQKVCKAIPSGIIGSIKKFVSSGQIK